MGTVTSYTAAKIDELIQTATGGGVTQEQLDAAIAGLIDASPAALDTLNELAAAIGDDPNFSGNITALIADRVRGTVRLTVASTAPASPSVNDIWIDTT